MKNLNRVTLLGSVTNVGHLKNDPGSIPRFEFVMTTVHAWVSPKDKKRYEDTEVHDLIVFDTKAIHAHKVIHPGCLLMVEGYLRSMGRDTGDGGPKIAFKRIVVSNFINCGKKQPSANDDRDIDCNF